MIKVLFIVGRYYADYNKEFGGTTMEYYNLNNAFKNDKEISFTICDNFDIFNYQWYRDNYDIIHCDDNRTIKNLLLNGMIPDVIGPTARAPLKSEESKKEWLDLGLNPLDFYKATVIRNTHAEERLDNSWEKIKYINLGVDTDKIQFRNPGLKRWVLWAGDVCRDAKNFQMFMDIMKITELPNGYNWKVLSGYRVEDYLKALENTALLINTSKNETFCFAMFEANSSGVPSIYKKGLHNPVGHKFKKEYHKDKTIQVEYTPEAYRDKILELLNNRKKLDLAGVEARQYAENFGSYKNIRQSFGNIYKEVYKNKNA